ncbi:SAM-dependent methyltransferase [Streptomyces sp. NPDC090022]|uniref:SAM-dependent methyltransferase n=1 Tax=Streptomyces sp. NPDC090022 TaxID=3365920 RepID=UPI00382677FD
MSEHEHDHARQHGTRATADRSEQEFWDERYRESDRIWSGKANAALVREVEGLPAGRALDLGCGEGADSVWLARTGWQVTGTDISAVALERAAEHAAGAGVADRIAFERHDLGASFPAGHYDLVSACFLHSPGDMPRERILRTAAAAVAPGGTLLIVGHAGWPSWEENPRPDITFPTAEEVLADLDLPEGDWEVQVCAEHERVQPAPDGRPGVRLDNALKIRRLG